jgi:MFS family permease
MSAKRLHNPMSPVERKAVLSLASIFSLRMFGLFMLLPVLAIYADELSGTTPVLLGLALGVYGLTQAIFQIPSLCSNTGPERGLDQAGAAHQGHGGHRNQHWIYLSVGADTGTGFVRIYWNRWFVLADCGIFDDRYSGFV